MRGTLLLQEDYRRELVNLYSPRPPEFHVLGPPVVPACVMVVVRAARKVVARSAPSRWDQAPREEVQGETRPARYVSDGFPESLLIKETPRERLRCNDSLPAALGHSPANHSQLERITHTNQLYALIFALYVKEVSQGEYQRRCHSLLDMSYVHFLLFSPSLDNIPSQIYQLGLLISFPFHFYLSRNARAPPLWPSPLQTP